jgi:hypothetical protein
MSTLIAAFQAAIIYSIILLFPAPRQPPRQMFDLPTLSSMQNLGLHVTRSSLVRPEELIKARPKWKDWIEADSKRRALLLFYAFEWINAKVNNFAELTCGTPGVLPAPSSKVLWTAANKQEWEVAYDRWLGRWAGQKPYSLRELFEQTPDAELDERSEMWLEETDELGMLLMVLGKLYCTMCLSLRRQLTS